MSDLKIIKEMMNDFVKVPIKKDLYQRHFIELVEPRLPDCLVTIYGIPANTIAIKVDEFKLPEAIFCGSKGECKRADYIIFSEEAHKKIVLYIEMKKTKGNFTEIVQQLYGALCFVRYCEDIGQSFWKEKYFMQEYQHRFVSIGHISIAKKPTRITRNSNKHDTPENAMKIDWPSKLQFKHLAGSS
ncbi:MAG: hypothetical protein JSR33_03405 [Proteobacteria bacterium]|nr:hypothetical protein [Pseudomonadota bacterium]